MNPIEDSFSGKNKPLERAPLLMRDFVAQLGGTGSNSA